MYTPNNPPVYLRAVTGFMAAISAAATSDTAAGNYTLYAQMADAWGQQVDTLWGASAPTNLELDLIETGSSALWTGRTPPATDVALSPGNYTQTAEALIARVSQANAQVVSEGVDPNATGGGSPAGWVTALDVDFANQPAQTLAGPGPFEIGGFSWLKVLFSGDENVAPVITPGLGLTIQPASGATFSSEQLVVMLTDILPPAAQKYPTSVRVWVQLAASNFDVSGGNMSAVVLNLNSGDGALAGADYGDGFVFDNVNHGNGDYVSVGYFATDSNVVVLLEVPGLDAFGSRLLGGLSPLGTFPLDSDHVFAPGGPFLAPILSLGPPRPEIAFPIFPPDSLALYALGAGIEGTVGTSGTIRRIRIDYKI
jgi:hypothetical protein